MPNNKIIVQQNII